MNPQDVILTSAAQPPITWIDIARTLAQLDPSSSEWINRPSSLTRANVDWLGATFEFSDLVLPTEEFFSWLRRVFPQRVERSGATASFVLEGPTSRLPIDLKVGDRSITNAFLPLGGVESSIDFHARMPRSLGGLPIIACHSVKGGTGRTTTALVSATQWAEKAGKPVLIVDADLEAPGLSYLYRASRGSSQVSFEDVVALAHSDDTTNWSETAGYVATKMPGQRIGDLFVLPLRRDLDELASSSIRAEHLASSRNPFALADILRSIALKMGCAGIVVDIRAGLVPLAAQLILDPSVNRIFVSSLGGQSLDGTVALVRYISREARRRQLVLGRPLLVVNRIPSVLRETGTDDTLLSPALEQITYELLKGRSTNLGSDEAIFSTDDDIQPIAMSKIPEIADLQATSTTWEGYIEQVHTSGFFRRLAGDFNEWLQQTSNEPQTVSSSEPFNVAPPDRDTRCRQLAEYAEKLIAAEVTSQPIEAPLVTRPLRALAEQFVAQLPIVVSEGAKGTGKTLTARFLVARESWSSAVAALSPSRSTSDAPILPVLGSIQASESFQNEIDSTRRLIARSFGFSEPQTVHATTSKLRAALGHAVSDQQRASVWLNAIAWSAGFQVDEPTAGEALLRHLREHDRKLLAVFEGLEELYADPFAGQTPQWLRSLLVDLPQRLRSEPGRPLGLLVFSRRDSVDAAVPQNSDQFRLLYKAFSLTWSEADVLELAAWLSTKSGALNIWSSEFQSLSQSEREEKLFPLWGRKLGPDDKPGRRTAEAYTANWIIAVLSDMQSRLVARDLVRLLDHAAVSSVGNDDSEFANTRLLTPQALKLAVKPTSIAKVKETQEEIAELGPVFDKFRQQPDRVVAPLDSSAIEVLELTQGDISLLQRHGILFGDAPPYEVPELFRMGLNLRHSGARHSVINLRRRARQRLGLSA